MVPITLLYNLRRCCADVMAPSTDSLFTRDLMLEAVPYSSPNIFCTRAICMSKQDARRQQQLRQQPWMELLHGAWHCCFKANRACLMLIKAPAWETGHGSQHANQTNPTNNNSSSTSSFFLT